MTKLIRRPAHGWLLPVFPRGNFPPRALGIATAPASKPSLARMHGWPALGSEQCALPKIFRQRNRRERHQGSDSCSEQAVAAGCDGGGLITIPSNVSPGKLP